ncbi:MAG TPA: glycosyltransferase family 39 protein [Terriglobales bacterium]|nr:glycosyltransferase family 39 protein [Terriglobales bacterium]
MGKTSYSAGVRELLRKHREFFWFATLAAMALRLLFILGSPAITADSLVYGDIAKNWLQHGIYGLSGPARISPTDMRLPGYPAFLALVFSVFGTEHYRAVLLVQMVVDLASCFVIADLARRLLSPRAAQAAFLLSALCPFLANYAAAALTETGEVFFTVLALDFAIRGCEDARGLPWLACGLACGGAMLFRPDGALLPLALELYLGALIAGRLLGRIPANSRAYEVESLLRAGLVLGLAALLPLVPWTVRNWHTLQVFQPLAPRYANQANAFVHRGFERWMKTWIADYASTEEIYWAVPGNPIDSSYLPTRAFDSPEQEQETKRLLADYNQRLEIGPELDSRFERLAEKRIRQDRWRYWVWLPCLRIASMWLRPRTEILPCNRRWWEFDEEPQWLAAMIVLGIVNLLYLAAAVLALVGRKQIPHRDLFLGFVILRSAFLGTLENPESRYTLELYPVVILLAASLWGNRASCQEKPPDRRRRFEQLRSLLTKWGVGHAKACADMLGEQFDGRSIAHRIGLGQILHGLDQQALAIDVARIRIAFPPTRRLRRNGNGKNLGHRNLLARLRKRIRLIEYNARPFVFQPLSSLVCFHRLAGEPASLRVPFWGTSAALFPAFLSLKALSGIFSLRRISK